MAKAPFLNGLKEFYQAHMQPHLRRTPIIRSEYFSQKFGCNLYFKLENIQHTGSFKVRGALAKAMSLTKEQQKQDFLAASAGNHGLGVSYAARVLGTKAHIYMPKTTPNYKIRKIVELGGNPVIEGNDWDSSNEAALKYAKETGYNYFHPFSDEDVMKGQATIALEVFEDVPDADVVLCSIGGGGLISGIGAYAKSYNENVKVYGVETAGADSMAQSYQAGQLVRLPEIASIAESISVKEVTELTFDYVKTYVDDVYVVSDDESLLAQKDILQQEKQMAEPAMSCCIAALEKNMVPDIKGKNVVVILCGANYPVEKLGKTLQGESLLSYKTPKSGMVRKLQEMGVAIEENGAATDELLEQIKQREMDGYGYHDATASLEVYARQSLNQMPQFFDLKSFRVFDERRVNAKGEEVTVSEAAIKVTAGEREAMTVAESFNGPVDALNAALKKALLDEYPALNDMRLTDYKVTILNPHKATEARTRVLIESHDESTDQRWVTVGISANIIDASYQALQDAIQYVLLKRA